MSTSNVFESDIGSDWLRNSGIESILGQCQEKSPKLFHHDQLGFFSIGLPPDSFRPSPENRRMIFWFPYGIPTSQSVAMVSSRLGKKLDQQNQLFDAIRTHFCRFDRDDRFIVSHDSTATFPALRRAAELFHVPFVEFRRFPAKIDLDWFLGQLSDSNAANTVFYEQLDKLEQKASIDKFLIESSCEIRVLGVRRSGNIHKAVLGRLDNDCASRIFVLRNGATVATLQRDLIERGAIGWYLYSKLENEVQCLPSKPFSQKSYETIDAFKRRSKLSDYLAHWTRRCNGPWPNQTNDEFQDELIFHSKGSEHDRVNTLIKILADQTLIAGNNVTRDHHRVVCFTEVPLDEFCQRRTFRSHLNRWDFETVGIAIKKQVLQNLGARRVIYGDESCWQNLDKNLRPYFQKSDGKIDWSFEKEWRITDNLDLGKINASDAFVFVDDQENARKAAAFTNLPIIVLTASQNSES